jgi:hypothetical protein
MSWTIDHYQAVRENLSDDSREVFDEMAYQGLRLLEVAGPAEASRFRARWHRAVTQSGVEYAPPERLRNDYYLAAWNFAKEHGAGE